MVISPGPCTPAEAGASLAVIARCAGRIPLLGVCLGHQAIAAAFSNSRAPIHPLAVQAGPPLILKRWLGALGPTLMFPLFAICIRRWNPV